MKADTAAIRIKNGICQKMIQVDEHGAQHYQTGITPVFSPEQSGKNKWQQKMTGIMDYMPENTNVQFHAIRDSFLLIEASKKLIRQLFRELSASIKTFKLFSSKSTRYLIDLKPLTISENTPLEQ